MARTMTASTLRRLCSRTLVAALVLLALLLSGGRWLMGSVAQHRDVLQSWLSERLPYEISINRLSGDWRYLSPVLYGYGVTLSLDDDPVLRLRALEVELDLIATLVNGVPVARRIRLDGLKLSVWRSDTGAWQLAGAGDDPGDGAQTELLPLLQALALQREVIIRNAELQLTLMDRQQTRLTTDLDLAWQNRFGRQRLYTHLGLGESGAITLRGEATGTPGTEAFRGRYYLRAGMPDAEWWQLMLPSDPRLPSQVALSGELWGTLNGVASHRVQGRLALPSLDWQLNQQPLQLRDAAAQWHWRSDAQGWQGQITQLAGDLNGTPLELADLYLSGDSWLPTLVATSKLELGPLWERLNRLALLPPALGERLRPLAPQGVLRNLQLRCPPDGALADTQLLADLDQVAVGAWKGAPEARGISGRLRADRQGGRVDLDSQQFWLSFPELYRQGWQFDQARGAVSWQIGAERVAVESELLTLAGDKVNANGRFRVEIPLGRAEPEEAGAVDEGHLTLMIGMQQSDGALAPLFVPDKIVEPALFRWLDGALNEGALRYGGLVYDAPLLNRDEVPNDPTLQMFFDTTDARVRYQPGWPAVHDADAFTLIRGSEVLVQIPQGRVYEHTRIEQAEVYLPPRSRTLEVRARMNGPAADGRLALLESPIGELLGEEFARWQLQGKLHTELNLGIDLAQTERSTIRVDTHVQNGEYWSEALNLRITDLEGSIHYHEQRGLHSEMLSGRFFGRPLAAQIDTQGPPERATTRIRGWGGISMASVREWTGLPLLDAFSGETDYRFELGICGYKAGCSELRLDSNLLGVQVDAPAPFAKSGSLPAPFTVALALTPEYQWLRLEYPQLQALLGLRAGVFLGGELGLGMQPVALQQRTDGVKVSGQLAHADLALWRAFIERHFLDGVSLTAAVGGADAPGDSRSPLRELDLRAAEVRYAQQRLTQVDAHLMQQPDRWWLSLSSQEVGGIVTMPLDEGQPYVAELSHLYLPSFGGEGEGDPLAAIDPRQLPRLDFSVEELRWGGEEYGRWRLQLRPDAHGAHFSQIKGAIRGMALSGELEWLFDGSQHQTAMILDSRTGDLGKVMEAWGSAPSMETESTRFEGALDWAATPAGFDWALLNGEATLNAQRGRILDTGDRPVVKLFSLFNMSTLMRRLSLDFADLTKEGTSFDRIDAHVRLQDGVARTLEPATVISPTHDLEFDGQVDLARETVDLEMLVQLPVAENLPIAAALLASPTIAGAAFLVERLIGKKLKRFTSVRYRLAGPWADTQINPVSSRATTPDNTPLDANH